LRSALKQPSLFYRSPASIQSNIDSVADHFRAEGLTLSLYLRAALRQPSLFSQSPATLIANIENVAEHFHREGLTLANYLRAALKQPQLFHQTPATLIRHVQLLIDMHRQGLVTFRGTDSAPPNQLLAPLFAFLVTAPSFFCLSDDNYALRIEYARVSGERPGGTTLLTRSRRRVEEDLARVLGQPMLPPLRPGS
jgi:hypothetical protein